RQLEALTKEQTRSAEQMAAVEKTFGVVIGNIEAITQRAATAPLQGMEGEITGVIGQLTQVNSSILGLTERMPQLIATFRQSNEAMLSEIRGAAHAQQSSLERMSRVMQSNRPSNAGTLGVLSYVAAGAAV